MSFTAREFARLRPFLYHLTARENVDRVRRLGRLEPVSTIAGAAGRPELRAIRRREHVHVEVGADRIIIRDQAPLHRGNMRLDNDWTFERFIAHLNERVFFWPGSPAGPIPYGLRHFARYESENPAILRAPTLDVFEANPAMSPLFCRFNSGSPRCTHGRPSPRGATTFVAAEEAGFRGSQVVEVTFPGTVELPPSTQLGARPVGPWQSL